MLSSTLGREPTLKEKKKIIKKKTSLRGVMKDTGKTDLTRVLLKTDRPGWPAGTCRWSDQVSRAIRHREWGILCKPTEQDFSLKLDMQKQTRKPKSQDLLETEVREARVKFGQEKNLCHQKEVTWVSGESQAASVSVLTQLCDCRQVTVPLRSSVFWPGKWKGCFRQDSGSSLL